MSKPQTRYTESTQIEAESAADTEVNEGVPIGFFAIGLLLNLALIGAFGLWAWRNWHKADDRDKP